jgi:hypothetical protein
LRSELLRCRTGNAIAHQRFDDYVIHTSILEPNDLFGTELIRMASRPDIADHQFVVDSVYLHVPELSHDLIGGRLRTYRVTA